MLAVVRDRGLITLEWLLIVGAIAGLAASTVLIVQNVVDDTSDVPVDPISRLIEADISAAQIASDAQRDFNANPTGYVDTTFNDRCQIDLRNDYDEAVASAAWQNPAGPDGLVGTSDDVAAKCDVTPHANLGG